MGEGIEYDHFGFSISDSDIIDDVYLPTLSRRDPL